MNDLSYLNKLQLQKDHLLSEEAYQKKEANNEVLRDRAYFNTQWWRNALIFSKIRPTPTKRIKKLPKSSKLLKRKMRLKFIRVAEEAYELEKKRMKENQAHQVALASKNKPMTFHFGSHTSNSTLPNDGFFPDNRAPRRPRPAR